MQRLVVSFGVIIESDNNVVHGNFEGIINKVCGEIFECNLNLKGMGGRDEQTFSHLDVGRPGPWDKCRVQGGQGYLMGFVFHVPAKCVV